LEKYASTAASDSVRVISLVSLSHEKGLEKAWLARPTRDKRFNKCMVASIRGDVESGNPSFIFHDIHTLHRRNVMYSAQGSPTKTKQGITSRVVEECIQVQGSILSGQEYLYRSSFTFLEISIYSRPEVVNSLPYGIFSTIEAWTLM
jgi:hypothetical protein